MILLRQSLDTVVSNIFKSLVQDRDDALVVRIGGLIERGYGSINLIDRISNNYVQFRIYPFLPLDEAIASRAVFVIIFESGGRKCFWSQPNNSKTVRDRPCVNGKLIGTYGGATE